MPLRAGELKRLRIGELRTDEGVLPRALSLNIEGQGQVGRNGGRTELAVLPLDGNGDELLADLTWSDDFRLDGTLNLDAPAGGLFASLAQLGPEQSMSARLEAGGVLDDWQTDAEILIDGASAIALDASAENEIIRFQTELHPALHPLTASLAETLGEEIRINGDLSRDGSEPVLNLDAEAEGLRLTALARQTEEGGYQADLDLAVDTPTRYADIENVSVNEAVLDGMLVYVEVKLDRTTPEVFDEFARAIRKAEEVMECHMVAGGFDYLIKARVRGMDTYRSFLSDVILSLPGIRETHTYAVMEEIKNTDKLPV